MRDIVVTIAVFGMLPFILRTPWIGILVFTWLSLMNPHRLAYGFSLSFPFAMIVALTTLVALLFSKEIKKIIWTRESIILALFVIWMCITTTQAIYPADAQIQLDKVLKIQLMIFVALMIMRSFDRIEALLWVSAASIGFYGFKGGIFTILRGGVFRVQGPPGTFIGGNNEIGLALAIPLGALALGRGMWTHGYMMPSAVGALGLGVMAGSLTLPHGDSEVLYTMLGVGLLALGHDLNRRAHA